MEYLRHLRNTEFGHSVTAKIESAALAIIVEKVKERYATLKVTEKSIDSIMEGNASMHAVN